MKKILCMLLAVMMVLATASFAFAEEESDAEYILGNGVLNIGITLFAPINYEDPETGELIGFDTELAKAVCADLGIEANFIVISWDAKEIELNSKNIDCIWNGMCITPEREEEVLFSIPYATAVQSVIVREGYEEIATLDDLVGKIVGVQMSTTGDLFVSDMEGVEVRQYSSGTNAAMDLAAGRVDAVMIDSAPAASIVSNIEGLVILEGIEMDEESYSIAFAKDNTELVEKFNAALEELTADGTIPAIIEKYIPAE